jgi:hypothetical protein
MTRTEARNELRRLELSRTTSTRYLGAQIALETARVNRLTERLSLEDETVYLITTDPDDDEVDEIRLGQVDSRKCWANARRLCPNLLDDLDAIRSQWDADAEMVTADRRSWESEYAYTRGVS